MGRESWRELAAGQAGLITRAQLAGAGVDRWAVAHRIDSERWQLLSPTVVATTTGLLTREQRMWHGVLHAGEGSLVGGLTAAEVAGLRNWQRDTVTILVPYSAGTPSPLAGIDFVRTRRPHPLLRSRRHGLPVCLIEPATLLFASADRSQRTAQGVLAAVIQQRLATPESLLSWVDLLRPLRRSPLFREVLVEFAGGVDSVAELDVNRMCREHGLARPQRQVRRRGSDGRVRYTDCEWRLRDGRVLVLEIDGAFHMEVEHWEDDLARQRALTAADRLMVRCTSRELRDESPRIADDLRRLGVPAA